MDESVHDIDMPISAAEMSTNTETDQSVADLSAERTEWPTVVPSSDPSAVPTEWPPTAVPSMIPTEMPLSSSDMNESAVAVSVSFFARHKEELLVVLLASSLTLLAYVTCSRGRGHKYATIYMSDTQTGADEELSEEEEAEDKEPL